MYDLYDINGDDFPELFLSDGDYHVAAVTIYTYTNGTGKQLENGRIGSYGSILFHENTGLLIDTNMGQGYFYRTDWYMDGDALVPVFSCSDNTGAVEDPADYAFTINGETVTDEEYYEVTNQRDYYASSIELGRSYSVSD